MKNKMKQYKILVEYIGNVVKYAALAKMIILQLKHFNWGLFKSIPVRVTKLHLVPVICVSLCRLLPTDIGERGLPIRKAVADQERGRAIFSF